MSVLGARVSEPAVWSFSFIEVYFDLIKQWARYFLERPSVWVCVVCVHGETRAVHIWRDHHRRALCFQSAWQEHTGCVQLVM